MAQFFYDFLTFILVLCALFVAWFSLYLSGATFVFEHYLVVVINLFLNIGLSYLVAYKKFTFSRWILAVLLLVFGVILAVLAQDGNQFFVNNAFVFSFIIAALCTAAANIFFGMLKEHRDANKNNCVNTPKA